MTNSSQSVFIQWALRPPPPELTNFFFSGRCELCMIHLRNFLTVKKKIAFSLLQFRDVAKAAKKPFLLQTEHSELNSFTNMVAKVNIDTFKV